MRAEIQPYTIEQMQHCVNEICMIKNSTARVGGFSPSQWVLGQNPRGMPSFMSEESFADLGAVGDSADPGSMKQELLRREPTCISTQTKESLEQCWRTPLQSKWRITSEPPQVIRHHCRVTYLCSKRGSSFRNQVSRWAIRKVGATGNPLIPDGARGLQFNLLAQATHGTKTARFGGSLKNLTIANPGHTNAIQWLKVESEARCSIGLHLHLAAQLVTNLIQPYAEGTFTANTYLQVETALSYKHCWGTIYSPKTEKWLSKNNHLFKNNFSRNDRSTCGTEKCSRWTIKLQRIYHIQVGIL